MSKESLAERGSRADLFRRTISFGELDVDERTAFWVYDPKRRRIEYADPGLEEMWGTRLDDIHQMLDRVGEGEDAGALRSFITLMESQRVGAPPARFDYRTRYADGRTVWVRLQYVRVHDPERGRELIMGRSADVTDLKAAEAQASHAWSELEARVRDRTEELVQANRALSEEVARRTRAEDALRASTLRLEALVEHSFDFYCEVDQNGCFLDANTRLLEVLDCSREELIGRHFSEMLDDPTLREELEPVVSTPTPGTDGGRIQLRSMRGRLVHVDWASVRSVENGVNRVIGIGRNVTDQVIAEQRFAELFQAAPDAQVAVDSQGLIRQFNRQAERLYGWSAAEVIGKPVWILSPKREREAKSRLMLDFIASPTPWRLGEEHDISILRKDGTELPVELSLAPLRAGDEVYVVASIRDLSARKRERAEHDLLEAQVRQWQKLESLGVLAGGVAHDFNNLLAAVMNYANVALLHGGEAPVRESLGQIKLVAGRMSDLAGQMLTYAGRGPSAMENVDLNREIEEMRALLAASSIGSVAIEEELSASLPKARIDPSQLRQVVMNLTLNAVEAQEGEGGRIALRTGSLSGPEDEALRDLLLVGELPKEAVYLEVEDDGRGMDGDTVQRMFEPFFSTREVGRGLGLAVVVGIVRRHAGAIGVSSAPGVGTRMLVALPAAELDAKRASPERRPPARFDGRRILLVEDEPAVRESAIQLLEARGAEVVACVDGAAALAALDGELRFDAVLLDRTLPDIRGEEVFRVIRKRCGDLPVVLCSGHAPETSAEPRAPDANALHARKPYDLEAVVAWALRRARSAAEEAGSGGVRA